MRIRGFRAITTSNYALWQDIQRKKKQKRGDKVSLIPLISTLFFNYLPLNLQYFQIWLWNECKAVFAAVFFFCICFNVHCKMQWFCKEMISLNVSKIIQLMSKQRHTRTDYINNMESYRGIFLLFRHEYQILIVRTVIWIKIKIKFNVCTSIYSCWF